MAFPSSEELRLRLAMNLFRNWEPSLIDNKEGGYNLSFSVALQGYYDSLLLCKDLLPFPHDQLKALETCIGFAKTIEKARQSSAASRQELIQHLSKEIENKLQKLVEEKNYSPLLYSWGNDGICQFARH